MDKYNINRNREELTPQDVQKGQDFDAFMKAYSARPRSFWGSKTMYMSIATVGIIAIISTVVVLNTTDANPKTETTTAFVEAPFKNLDVQDTTYVVNAANGADFIYNTGSLIHVPQNAFVDSAGNKVSGNVEIHYREFHDPASIFLAGIPMTYDSAGQQYHFESAGMLEITAWQNGKPLKVNPESQVNVAMASNTNDPKFNVYYLDTVKKNWNFIAKDKAIVAGFDADTTKPSVLTTASIAPPIEPKKADKNKPSFVIAFEPKDFPELAVYKGVRFEVDENKTPYDKKDKKIQWEDVSIKRNADKESYTVTFSLNETTRSYVTTVVVDEANYAASKKIFEKKYAEYQAALLKKADDQVARANEHEGQLMNADARRIFVNDSVLARALRLRRANVGSDKENMVMREFMLENFGIWNSDCPSSLPQGPEMFVHFIDSKTKKELVLSHVYLVEKGKNAIFTYYDHDFSRFRYNHDADNLAWAITTDGKLAVLPADAFKHVKDGEKEVKFEMDVSDVKLASGVQARMLLGIGS